MRSAERVAPPDLEARRIEVRGVVQGVGFRPFVWRLAERHGVAGRVRNASGVVEIQAEGAPGSLDAFAAALAGEAPPLARVEAVACDAGRRGGTRRVRGRTRRSTASASGSSRADAATCAACLAELFDPDDRRYRYPFINCTDCGPRFTIIEALPYDRERTSMRAFPMCDDCRREYGIPVTGGSTPSRSRAPRAARASRAGRRPDDRTRSVVAALIARAGSSRSRASVGST